MHNAAAKLELTGSALEDFDANFLGALKALTDDAIKGAAACTDSIFKLSSAYVERETFDTLKKFYSLYFDKSAKSEAKLNDINAKVDDIFESAVAAIATGKAVDDEGVVKDDETSKQERLAAASLQKHLEGLLVLDQGIRSEILPALSSMQFEDATRQRLEHVISGWHSLVGLVQGVPLDAALPTAELDATLDKVARTTSSIAETEEFYRIVMKAPVPEALKDGSAGGSVLLF